MATATVWPAAKNARSRPRTQPRRTRHDLTIKTAIGVGKSASATLQPLPRRRSRPCLDRGFLFATTGPFLNRGMAHFYTALYNTSWLRRAYHRCPSKRGKITVHLRLLDLLQQRVPRTADLQGNGSNRCPAEWIINLLIQHHTDCPFTNLRGKLVRRLAHRRPFLSGVRASGDLGAVHIEIGDRHKTVTSPKSASSSHVAQADPVHKPARVFDRDSAALLRRRSALRIGAPGHFNVKRQIPTRQGRQHFCQRQFALCGV